LEDGVRIPPGVTEEDFGDALRQFEEAVGIDWVLTYEEDVDTYRDAWSPMWGEPEERIASAAIVPDTVEQVQQVVKIANSYKIPLWTVSTGRNFGYGAASPALSGTVILDLKRMNRILEVNEKHAYALVEPGVSYFDLYRYVKEKGINLWVDFGSSPWGSLLGNALDHGMGGVHYPYFDHFEAKCGMELVLANGEVIRTGMGALPNARTWQQYKYGYGPHIDGMFSQSNFGIVTKMGLWMHPMPKAYRACFVSVPKYDDVVSLADILREMTNEGVLRCGADITGSLNWLVEEPEVVALYDKPGGPSTEEVEQFLQNKGMGWWRCVLGFYGLPEVIDAEWAYAQKRLSAIPGANCQTGKLYSFPLDPKIIPEGAGSRPFGIPNLGGFYMGERGPRTFGLMWFSAVLPYSGEAIQEFIRVCTGVCEELGTPPVFSGGDTAFGRGAISATAMGMYRAFVISIPIRVYRDNTELNKKARQLYNRFVEVGAEHGWGTYRTSPAFMDEVADIYSFNNRALWRFHETIKDAVDPNGILSPGKSGIWPKRLRDSKG